MQTPEHVARELLTTQWFENASIARGVISEAIVSLAVVDAALVTVSTRDMVAGAKYLAHSLVGYARLEKKSLRVSATTERGRVELEVTGETDLGELEMILAQVTQILK